MRKLQKTILILSLSFSNLAFLGLVFYTYFSTHPQSLKLASTQGNTLNWNLNRARETALLRLTGEDASKPDKPNLLSNELNQTIKDEIARKCGQHIEALKSGQSSRRSCWISVKNQHKKARFEVKTDFELIRTQNGIVIRSKERVLNPSWHATEANFCDSCPAKSYQALNIENVTERLIDISQTINTEVYQSVQQAFEPYNRRNLRRRVNLKKEQNCEGSWEAGDFTQFDLEEKLRCKMKRIDNFNYSIEKEEYYHTVLKKELWETITSGELDKEFNGPMLLKDLLNEFHSNIMSVNFSKNFLSNYLTWKEDFDILESPAEQDSFLQNKGIERSIMALKRLIPKQAKDDLDYFNKATKGASNRLLSSSSSSFTAPSLNQAPRSGRPSTPSSSRPNFDAIYNQY